MNTEDVVFDSLSSDFRFFIDKVVHDLRGKCESEIEVMLGAAMFVTMRLTSHHDVDLLVIPGTEECAHPSARYLLIYQYPFGKYRIDWVFRVIGAHKSYVFIECDGHEFHERTKEQAERDRSKDREIQAAGFPILRFTGREIYRDVGKCILEIFEMAVK